MLSWEEETLSPATSRWFELPEGRMNKDVPQSVGNENSQGVFIWWGQGREQLDYEIIPSRDNHLKCVE